MTENLPPEPSSQEKPCAPDEDHSEDPLGYSDESVSLTDEVGEGPVQEGVFAAGVDGGQAAVVGSSGGESDLGPVEFSDESVSLTDEVGEGSVQEGVFAAGVDGGQDPAVVGSSGGESVPGPVESPFSERSRPSSGGIVLRGMGWQMMAVAGAALLLAGFAAGLFLPGPEPDDPVSEQVTVATTTETAPATTSAPPATTLPPPTVPATSAPTTTTADTQPVSEVPPLADLVVTDEPVADVADRLVPSVVHLEITSNSIFDRGAGSGVIFDSQGYIFTAAHVVKTVAAGDADLTVRLSNGDRLPGEVVGTDPDSDVAVVRVDRTGLVAAELVLDPPRVGQLVVAVGSPWGLESSVTSGVISATDRIVDGKLLIQSDAVLYPGNSGGALADRYGRLIGINVSIFTDSTTLEPVEFQGVGFAVPMDVAYRVASALIAGEPVHTTFLGVSGRDSPGDAGVEIMEVFPGSGAETAGLMVGDVVVAVNGRPVKGISDLAARIRHRVPGDQLVLNILRGNEEISLIATLLPRSEVMGDPEDAEQSSPEEDQLTPEEGEDDTP
ncbi:MAG: trypsin-like peptidase domain-containing protein [bacterium]|nr:trypsin-like peptidase domain-containing protein [bacterium]